MNKEKRIENYFDRVKQNPPIIEIEKVNQIITKAEVEAKVEVKKGRRNILKFIIMTTIFAVIISAFLFWSGSDEQFPESKPQNTNAATSLTDEILNEIPSLIKRSVIIDNLSATSSENLTVELQDEESKSETALIKQLKPEFKHETFERNEEIKNRNEVVKTNELRSNVDNHLALANAENKSKTSKKKKVSQKQYPTHILDSTIFIELNKEELEKLGFNFIADTVQFFFKREDRIMGSIITNNFSMICMDIDDYNSTEPTKFTVEKINDGIMPMFVTDADGTGYLSLSFPEKEIKERVSPRFKKNYKTLIPVIVKKGLYPKQPKTNKIYWFLPTDNFFNNLPTEISNQILEENNYIRAEDKSKLVQPECKYFDECKNTLKVDDFKVFPNPANNNATVTFSLSESIEGRISLVDLAGRERQVLQAQAQFGVGNHRFDLDVSEVPEGIYLITLYSESGVQVQRFIVTK